MLRCHTETGVLEGKRGDPENSATLALSLGLRRFFFGDLIVRMLRVPTLGLEGNTVL